MKSRLLVLLLAAVFALTACSTQKKLESDDDFSVEAEDSANKGKVEDLALEQPAANTNSNADDLSLDTAPATTDAAAQPKPTKSANQESDLALENELNSLDNSAGGAQPTNKANQNDLSLEEPATNTAQTPPPAQDLNQNNPQNQSAEIPPPAIVTPEATATTPPPAETVTPSDGTVATINNVQYKGNVNGGTIAIAADKPVQFTTRLNATTNQFVVEVQNSKIPQKLKRSLNTKDMASSIGSVDIYQKEGSNVSRFVVQLRPGSPNPIVQQEGNSLLIIASGNKAAMAAQSAAQAAPQDNGAQASPNLGTPDAGSISADMGTLNSPAEVSTATAGTGSSTTLVDGDAGNAASTGTDLNLAQSHKGILTYDNLDEFLMGDTKYYGKKINLETSGMDTSEALKFLAEESGDNIMLDDSVMN
ncbi:MAG: AMIN domain-containing protein, partial [Pseudobdellovibrio sp.]